MKKQSQRSKKFVLGVTGSFGSGKTIVARLLAGRSAKIIDADRLAHKLILPGKSAFKKIIRVFGKGVLDSRGKLNRRKLADLVFADKAKIVKLNMIVHPEAIRQIKNEIMSSRKPVILDAPLLIEAGMHKAVDKLVVVSINKKEQVRRLVKKYGFSRRHILQRLKSQIPLKRKARLADFIIDNSGSIAKTRKQVALIRRKLWKN